ncbi:MAG: hypothetical protein ABI566_04525 [Pseudolysinimonas sp.]
MGAIKDLLESDDPDDRAAVASMRAAAEAARKTAEALTYEDPKKPNVFKRIWNAAKGKPMTLDEIVMAEHRFDHGLKKAFGRSILVIVVVQIIVANVLVVGYMFGAWGEHVEPSVIITWMSATVVETVGLMAIVTRYLYRESAHPEKQIEAPKPTV